MSEDEGNRKLTTQELENRAPGEDVDVDNIIVKILILCAKKQKLDSIATFLNRRGWEVVVTTKVEECIKVLASNRPDFVMVSMNHPNKKVSVLPGFIKQTFQSKCIAFGESTDSKTIGAIHGSKADYKMLGMVSGPSVHRKVKQILNDIYNPKEDKKSNKKSMDTSGPNSTVISGGMGGKAADKPSVQRFSRDSEINSSKNKMSAAEMALKMQQGTHVAGGIKGPDGSNINGPDSAMNKAGIAIQKGSPDFNTNNNVDGIAPPDMDKEGGNNGVNGFSSPEGNGLGINKGEGPNANGLDVNKGQGPDANGLGVNKGEGPDVNGLGVNKGEGLDANGLGINKGDGPEVNGLGVNKGEGPSANGIDINKGENGASGIGVDKGDALDKDAPGFSQESGEQSKPGVAQGGSAADLGTQVAKGEEASKVNEVQKGVESKESDSSAKGKQPSDEAIGNVDDGEGPSFAEDSLEMDPFDNEEEGSKRGSDIESQLDRPEISAGKARADNIARPEFSNGRLKELVPFADGDKKESRDIYESVSKTVKSLEPKYETETYLKTLTHLFVLPIQSEEESGFLLVATLSEIKNEEKFLEVFRRKMEEELNLGREDYMVEGIIKCPMADVNFMEFVKKTGDFHIIEMEGEADICTTFIPFDQPIPKVQQRLGHVKCEIEVEQLPVGKEFTFNSFLHLKKNKKYFMFLKEGNSIQQNQKERLIKRKVSLYINREEEEKYKQFYISFCVKEYIEDYIKSMAKAS